MPLYYHLQSWTFFFFILLPLLSLPLSPLSLQLSKWSVLSRYMLFLVEDRSRAWSCTLWEQDLTNLSEGGEWIPPKQTSSVYQSFLNLAGGDITQLMSQSSPLYIRWSESHHCSADVHYIQGKHEGFRLRPACTLGLQRHRANPGQVSGFWAKQKYTSTCFWNKTYPRIVRRCLRELSAFVLFCFTFCSSKDTRKTTSHPMRHCGDALYSNRRPQACDGSSSPSLPPFSRS